MSKAWIENQGGVETGPILRAHFVFEMPEGYHLTCHVDDPETKSPDNWRALADTAEAAEDRAAVFEFDDDDRGCVALSVIETRFSFEVSKGGDNGGGVDFYCPGPVAAPLLREIARCLEAKEFT